MKRNHFSFQERRDRKENQERIENKDAMEHLEIKENKELTTSVHWIPVHQKGHLVNLVMMVQTG